MTGLLVLRELSRYPIGTFAEVVHRNALLRPEAEAFVCGAERVSFREFNARVNRTVHALSAAGLGRGEVAGVLSWNRLEVAVLFGAAMKGGFVLAHFNPRLLPAELLHVIHDSGARVVCLAPEFAGALAAIRERLPAAREFFVFGEAAPPFRSLDERLRGQPEAEPEVHPEPSDPLVIFYTSGTTGTPRGALYTHRQKLENTCMKALDIGLAPGDRHLVVLPMFHVGGDSHIWPFFLMGGCNVILPEPAFNPAAVLAAIAAERITDVHIVPTQLIALLNHPGIETADLGGLKRIWYAASPMPTEVLKRGLARFGPIFLQGYGLTESGPHTTVLDQAEHRRAAADPQAAGRLASCGQPALGVQVRIVDAGGCDLPAGEIGEIIVRSPRIMAGYYRRPAETAEALRDGWLHTGDLGYYDEKGFIYIADRKKDMIVSGGENVYPKEVEEVLYRHPAVLEAAVVGIPDPYWVERVHALVVLKPGAAADAGEIIAFCKQRLAGYKTPKGVEFVDALPKSPQGKVLKREIRRRLAAGRPAPPQGA
jgi:acyl-CoA synthetase (AMP-forming)/AMP-acid ligase II